MLVQINKVWDKLQTIRDKAAASEAVAQLVERAVNW